MQLNAALDRLLAPILQVIGPLAQLAQRVGHGFGEQDVAGFAAVRYSPRHADAAAGDVEVLVDAGVASHGAGVDAHPQLDLRPRFDSSRDFDRAPRRRERVVEEDERHAVSRRQAKQSLALLRLPETGGRRRHFLQLLQEPRLPINLQFGVTDQIDEERVSQLQLRRLSLFLFERERARQIVAELLGVVVAMSLIERQGSQDHRLRGGGQFRAQLARFEEVAIALPPRQFKQVVRRERSPAGQHLVGDHAQRVNVACRDRLVAQLLRRHVGRSADANRVLLVRSGQLRAHFGDAEVNDLCILDSARLLQQNVFRFEVAVDHITLMHGGDRLTELPHQSANASQIHLAGADGGAQAWAGNILHHQIGSPVRQDANVERAHYAGMVDPRQRLYLLSKLLFDPFALAVCARFFYQRFDHHAITQLAVVRQMDDANAALLKFLLDHVAAVEYQAGRERFDASFGRG